MTAKLPEIPLHDTVDAGELVARENARAIDLLAEANAMYGRAFVRFADGRSRAWLARAGNPYGGEIDRAAHHLDAPGTHFLNLSHEWGCTVAIGPDPNGPGWRMARTLDWPLDGLGRNLVAARAKTPHGPYVNLTWPGFAGVVQGHAPGRFAAALNQPPMARMGGSFGLGLPAVLDWAINRLRLARSRALPPAHLLRLVFETCRDFAAARTLLAQTPLCVPAIFSLVGASEGCVVERTENAAHIHDAPRVATNHWQNSDFHGSERRTQSRERHAHMTLQLVGPSPQLAGPPKRSGPDRSAGPGTADSGENPPFPWLTPPVLNPTTRLALEANPSRGILKAQGFEASGPATEVLSLS
ncbi:MAG: hypothetical protein ACKVSF_05705 [Alphaproteobacteria bacterium]